MDRRTFVSTVGATVAGIGIAGCGQPGPGAEDTPEDGNTPETATPEMGAPETDTPDEGVLETETGTPSGETTTGAPGGEILIETGEIASGLTVVDHEFFRTDEGGALVGTIANRSRRTFTSFQVEAILFEDSSEIDRQNISTEGEINELEPNETWRFQITFEGDAINRANRLQIGVDNVDLFEGTETDTGGEETTTPTDGDSETGSPGSGETTTSA